MDNPFKGIVYAFLFTLGIASVIATVVALLK
jgi:hypothetical protein